MGLETMEDSVLTPMVSSSESEDSCRGSFIQRILCRKPQKDAEDDEGQSVSLREMFRYATNCDIACILFGSLFAVLGGIVQPLVLIIGGLITAAFLKEGEKVNNDNFSSEVDVYLIYMVICGILALLFCFIQSYLLRLSCTRITESIRFNFLEAVLQQDSEWFESNNSGSINSQLNENIDCISDGIGDKIGMLLRGFSMFISSAIICLLIDWRLTLIAITMGPITTLTLAFMAKVISGPSSRILENQNKASNLVEESIMNVKTVAACNAQKHFEKKYGAILKSGLSDSLKYHFWVGFFEGITFIEIYIVIGITLCYGIIGFHEGFIEQRSVLLITSTISLTAYYLGLLGPHLTAIIRAKLATAVIYKTIDRKQSIAELKQVGIILTDPEGRIVFDDVYFSYPNREARVLKGLSFKVDCGESIALVGQSGCGKSTTIGLLTRLYDISEGKLIIDGIPINDINVESLRKTIGIVQQEPCLFNGTIMDNIRLGREFISEDRAKEAAQLANAHEFIEALERGYNTIIGAGGISLSGGQKQRIAIARAIASDPKILLLDEATSALDTESERIVQAAINKASIGRTTIIIAHRLSTLRDVDRIYVVSNGRIEETGNHDELVEVNGIYAALARTQEIQQELSSEPHIVKETRRISIYSTPTALSTPKRTDAMDNKHELNNENPSHSGLLLIYSNMSGHYCKFLASLFFSCLRGSELPLLLVTYYITFQGLQSDIQISNVDYKNSALNALYVAIACGFLVWFGQSMQYLVSGWCAECVAATLRLRCIKSLLHRPIESFDCTESSAQSSAAILSQHPANIMGALDFRFTLNIGNLFSVIVGLALAYIFAWEIGLLGTGLCILLLMAAIINIKVSHNARHQKEKEDRSAEYAIEIVEQARTIQLLCVQQFFLDRYSEQQRNSRKYDKKISLVDSLNFGLTQSFVFFCDLVCYAMGTYFIYTGRYPTQTVFFAFMGAQVSGWSVMYSAPWFPEIIRAATSARILFTLIDDEKKIESKKDEGQKPSLSGSVRVDNITFAYPSRKDVAVSRNLNLSVNKGQRIALVGPSGCGKSTIINLLERFYDADSGKVILDSFDVLDLNVEFLRNNLALVGQEPVLFKGSIFENITMGLSEELISIENVMEACRVANAQKFIESFPEGYETDVGEGGKSLSGGQKQRIAIARAVIRNPKILLLDEATSALDTESEEIVQNALNDASNGRTCITIAHRLSSIQNSDRIYYIEKGTVVEYGTHEELISINGKYAKLVRAQSLSK